jgi:hypothetical protein
VLWRELKLAIAAGASIPELDEQSYVEWKEDELQAIHDKYLNPNHVEAPTEDDDDMDLDVIVAKLTAQAEEPITVTEAIIKPQVAADVAVLAAIAPEQPKDFWHVEYEKSQANLLPGQPPQTFTDWVSEALSSDTARAAMGQAQASATAREAAPTPGPQPQGGPDAGQSGAPDGKPPREVWSQIAPQRLAQLLGVPYSDRAADRAGLTFNTHGPNDPLRVDSRGMVWFKDEVAKPAIPKRRMRRKVKTVTANVEEIQTYRPDGGLDETFEIAGDEQHEIEIKISMPASQVGIYVDPRMPFKIHQYNGRRAFDHEEVIRYFGGSDFVPSTVKTIYIDIDYCYEITSVRDTIERIYREQTLRGLAS